MSKATDQILEEMTKAIQDAQARKLFVVSSTFERVDIARNFADLIETVMQAAANTAVELTNLCESETGNGPSGEDAADTFRTLISEDTSEYLTSAIREQAFDMELELGAQGIAAE